tara:strand:+ start:954 stop:1652 length:699 start_codon:yes stop_codon:yes gene_type:complete
MKQKVDFLKGSLLFKHLPDDQLTEIAKISEVENHAKNHIIFLKGEKANFIYIIISGWVKGFRTSFNGEETILGIQSTYTAFGDIASLSQTRYVATAQAVTPSKVLKIPYKEFIDIIKHDDQALDTIFKINAARQNRLVDEIEQLITCTAHERIGMFLLEMLKNDDITKFEDENIATISLPYAKSLVASQLGMQAETFSRAFAKLKKDSLIDADKRNITVTDITKLKRFCRIQ